MLLMLTMYTYSERPRHTLHVSIRHSYAGRGGSRRREVQCGRVLMVGDREVPQNLHTMSVAGAIRGAEVRT